MSITKKYLEDLGLTEEQVSSIFAERGKEIETDKTKLEKLQTEITEKDKSINELNETIKSFDGKAETLTELQEKVASYEKVESERKEQEQRALLEKGLKDRFSSVLGDNKFKHEDIEKGRFKAFIESLEKEDFKGKGDSEIFEAVTKDMDCFVNPQQQKIELPGGGSNPPIKTEFKKFF